jgi:hypothetical protein
MSQAIQNAAIALAHAILAEIKAGTPSTPLNQEPLQATPAAADPFASLSGMTPNPAPVEVTPTMIQEIVLPLISNPTAKARLQAVMQELGIAELPAARPDQLPTLYARFKAIAAEVNGAGAAAATSGGVNLI